MADQEVGSEVGGREGLEGRLRLPREGEGILDAGAEEVWEPRVFYCLVLSQALEFGIAMLVKLRTEGLIVSRNGEDGEDGEDGDEGGDHMLYSPGLVINLKEMHSRDPRRHFQQVVSWDSIFQWILGLSWSYPSLNN